MNGRSVKKVMGMILSRVPATFWFKAVARASASHATEQLGYPPPLSPGTWVHQSLGEDHLNRLGPSAKGAALENLKDIENWTKANLEEIQYLRDVLTKDGIKPDLFPHKRKSNCRCIKTDMPKWSSEDHGNGKLCLKMYSQCSCPHHKFEVITLQRCHLALDW